jgi:2-succinyl-6-hydroxy-2,4-cyclohexadiene-1-carboxylate synthase
MPTPTLHAVTTGRGPRLVLVHGFTQNASCWGRLLPRLAASRQVVAVDAPGHGGSSGLALGLWEGAAALGATGGRAVYAGYSMGGRLCLHLALAHPGLVQALVVISASPGIEDPATRARRRAADAAAAEHLEAVGVERFVDEWLSQPLFAGLPPEDAAREERLANTAGGLASSLRMAGAGAQEPLWDRLGELAMPVLVVAGAQDATYADIARRTVTAVGPNATLALIPGAGHAVPLERPDALADRLLAWLADLA